MSTNEAHGALSQDELARVAWHVSTRSNDNGGSCVEAGPVRDRSGRVAVRDSKDRTGPALVFTPDAWKAFVGGIKNGAHDLA